MIFIQPHGFTKERGDPDFVLSNGTRYAPTSVDYISALKDTILKAVPFLKFKVIHSDTGWANLAATTNTQGRLINGSNSPCYLNASYATGRFIHIEQAPYVRYPQVWYLLNNALLKVFPADPYTSVVSYFNAEQERKNILIQWETSEEKGNYGFELQKRMNNDEEWTFTTFISAYHNPGTYRYYDDPKGSDTVYYRLKQINADGSSKLLPPVSVSLLPSEEPVLYDNYPNPFNASTIISFEIPETGEAELSVFNILGEKIKTLTEGTLQGGYHKITFNAGDMPAGVYFYRLVTRGFAQTKKLTLLK